MKRKLLIAGLFLSITICLVNLGPKLSANNDNTDIIGYWKGTAYPPHGVQFTIFVTFKQAEKITGTIDIPEQGGIDIPLTDIQYKDGKLTFVLPSEKSIFFEGQLDLNTITGSGTQAKETGRFTLTKLNEAPKIEELISLSVVGKRKIIYIPASPQDGFDWPYFLVLPNNLLNNQNESSQKRYLFVDTNNTGSSNDVNECVKQTFAAIYYKQYSSEVAEKLEMPLLYPAFPRPRITYKYRGETNTFLTHSFDRDTATLHLKLKDPALLKILQQQFEKAGFDVNTFSRLDLQLAAMIQHAIHTLNRDQIKLESKVYLCGYSASGDFTDRFATLHPELVKAVASGATLDDMLLPLKKWKGKKLIFPIGIYDYQEIVGNPFDLRKHNAIARLIYMGEDDDQNVVPFTDCYGDGERNTIIKLWGYDILPRAKKLTELYGQSGGQGMFILDKGIKHSMSSQMKEYLVEFFEANQDSDNPVYPIPKDASQLKYTLYK
jgi:hypothetical protein